jgi:hypothetical protein
MSGYAEASVFPDGGATFRNSNNIVGRRAFRPNDRAENATLIQWRDQIRREQLPDEERVRRGRACLF